MADPFASGLFALFWGAASEAAEHVSAEGVRTTGVRIIRGRNDQMARLGDGQIVTGTHRIELQKAQLPDIGEGDTLIVGRIESGVFVGEEELRLTGERIGDDENLTWTIGAEPVDPAR